MATITECFNNFEKIIRKSKKNPPEVRYLQQVLHGIFVLSLKTVDILSSSSSSSSSSVIQTFNQVSLDAILRIIPGFTVYG